MTELYVGNLLYEVTLAEVRALVEPFGPIGAVDLFTATTPDHPHAYAFIQMDRRENAEAAVKALDGDPFMGRTLRVELAEVERAEVW
ncbi:MAG: RNA-binding protein [Caldilinea sp. CFX5]|nr:RNA-binding protein [Caldilinea sp. CFX5]